MQIHILDGITETPTDVHQRIRYDRIVDRMMLAAVRFRGGGARHHHAFADLDALRVLLEEIDKWKEMFLLMK